MLITYPQESCTVKGPSPQNINDDSFKQKSFLKLFEIWSFCHQQSQKTTFLEITNTRKEIEVWSLQSVVLCAVLDFPNFLPCVFKSFIHPYPYVVPSFSKGLCLRQPGTHSCLPNIQQNISSCHELSGIQKNISPKRT